MIVRVGACFSTHLAIASSCLPRKFNNEKEALLFPVRFLTLNTHMFSGVFSDEGTVRKVGTVKLMRI
jgi:hypothetical protein